MYISRWSNIFLFEHLKQKGKKVNRVSVLLSTIDSRVKYLHWIKDKGMGCVYVTHLRLTNSRFCIFYVKINYLEMHLMVSSRVIDSKVLRIAIQFEYFSAKKANIFGMSPDVLAFKVCVFTSDFIKIYLITWEQHIEMFCFAIFRRQYLEHVFSILPLIMNKKILFALYVNMAAIGCN